ncbi:MAG TPA: hypothetical protein VGK74_26610 [Symbiobacteriaceae bacterium]
MKLLPYLVLAAAGVVIFAVAWRFAVPQVLIGLYLVAGAAVSVGDLIVHAVGNLYMYNPNLLPVQQADGPLGLVLGDYWFVPALCCSLAAVPVRHRSTAAVFITFVFLSIETGFRNTGYFWYSGWRLWYSALLFPLCLVGLLRWLRAFERQRAVGFHRVLLVISAVTYLLLVYDVLTGLVAGLWGFQPHILPWSFQDKLLGMLLFHNLPATVLALPALLLGWARRASFVPAMAGAVALWLYGMRWLGLYRHARSWSPAFDALALALIFYGIGRLDRWLRAYLPPEKAPVK